MGDRAEEELAADEDMVPSPPDACASQPDRPHTRNPGESQQGQADKAAMADQKKRARQTSWSEASSDERPTRSGRRTEAAPGIKTSNKAAPLGSDSDSDGEDQPEGLRPSGDPIVAPCIQTA
jgi:hypothetical protein